jgi:hypothetical protein
MFVIAVRPQTRSDIDAGGIYTYAISAFWLKAEINQRGRLMAAYAHSGFWRLIHTTLCTRLTERVVIRAK